jgi:hypothetical protein
MSDMSLESLLFLLALWAFLIVLLLSWRVYKIRHLKKEELHEGIVLSEPFFSSFGIISKIILAVYGVFVSLFCFVFQKIAPGAKKLSGKPRGYFCKVSDYMRGKKKLEKNGCSGYWYKLHETVNGNGSSIAETVETIETEEIEISIVEEKPKEKRKSRRSLKP